MGLWVSQIAFKDFQIFFFLHPNGEPCQNSRHKIKPVPSASAIARVPPRVTSMFEAFVDEMVSCWISDKNRRRWTEDILSIEGQRAVKNDVGLREDS